VKSCKNS
jgi:hypothetical protein